MSKNDIRTKKSNISSEKEIENCYFRQSAKTVPLSKPVKYLRFTAYFYSWMHLGGGVESIAVSALHRSKKSLWQATG